MVSKCEECHTRSYEYGCGCSLPFDKVVDCRANNYRYFQPREAEVAPKKRIAVIGTSGSAADLMKRAKELQVEVAQDVKAFQQAEDPAPADHIPDVTKMVEPAPEPACIHCISAEGCDYVDHNQCVVRRFKCVNPNGVLKPGAWGLEASVAKKCPHYRFRCGLSAPGEPGQVKIHETRQQGNIESHLKWAEEIVRSWPDWKKSVLGREVEDPAREPVVSEELRRVCKIAATQHIRGNQVGSTIADQDALATEVARAQLAANPPVERILDALFDLGFGIVLSRCGSRYQARGRWDEVRHSFATLHEALADMLEDAAGGQG